VATFTEFALPIPDWVYPVWAVALAMLVLLAARISVGLRWTATTVALAYVGWRCVMWLILAGFGFPQSTVPFLMLLGAVVIDLICLAGLPWLIESPIGAVVVTTAVYVGAWLQATLVAAPPVDYASAPVAAALLLAGWLVLAGARARRQSVRIAVDHAETITK
jgi:hypothetical protein